MWSSASALPSCLGCQRYEVQLLHISSALPGRLTVWRFATAKDQKFHFPYFRSARTSKEFVLFRHLFYQDFQVLVSPLPHFISVGTFKDVKLRFRTPALPWLPKIWNSAFRISARPGFQSFIFHTCSVRASKYGYVHFRISSLPGLSKMWSCASVLLLCLDSQRSEVPLSVLPLGQESKDLVHLPHLFYQDFQIWISPLPHFISAGTSKDLKFRFHTSALPWLRKIWSSASLVPPYVLVMHSHTVLYVFRETSQVNIETT